jgi:Trypsin-co-occurring domain 1
VKQLVEFELEDGQTILMEVDEIESAVAPAALAPGQMAVKAQQTFEQAIANIRPMVSAIRKKFSSLTDPADEVEIKFSVKLSGQVQAVVATIGAEANYEITLRWKEK